MQTTTNTSEAAPQKRDLTPFIEQIKGQLNAAGAVGNQREMAKWMMISDLEKAFPDQPFTPFERLELIGQIG